MNPTKSLGHQAIIADSTDSTQERRVERMAESRTSNGHRAHQLTTTGGSTRRKRANCRERPKSSEGARVGDFGRIFGQADISSTFAGTGGTREYPAAEIRE